jgi:hypothetical protein
LFGGASAGAGAGAGAGVVPVLQVLTQQQHGNLTFELSANASLQIRIFSFGPFISARALPFARVLTTFVRGRCEDDIS